LARTAHRHRRNFVDAVLLVRRDGASSRAPPRFPRPLRRDRGALACRFRDPRARKLSSLLHPHLDGPRLANDLSDLRHPPPFPAVGGRGHAAAHQRAQGTPTNRTRHLPRRPQKPRRYRRLSSSDAAFSKKKPPLLPRLFFYASLSREPRRFSLRHKLTQTF
jgi:hypothetical protein